MNPESVDKAKASRVYRRLLGYVRAHWHIFLVGIVSMAVFAATQAGVPKIIEPLLDESFIQRDPEAIRRIPLILLGLFAIRGVSGFFSTYAVNWVGRRVTKQIRSEAFGSLLRLPTAYYDKASSGVLVSRITYNIEQIAESVSNAFMVLVRESLTVVALLGVMLYQSWRLTLFVIVLVPVLAALVRYVSKRFRRYSGRIQHSMGDVTQVTEEIIGGQQVVKIFGGEEYERERFEEVNEHNRRLHMKLTATQAGSVPMVQMIAGVGMTAIIMYATSPDVIDDLTAGQFVSFLGALLLVMAPLRHLTNVNVVIQRGIAAADSVFALIDSEHEGDTGTVPLDRAEGRIEYRNVDFTYSRDKGRVLHDVTFEVAPGETVAFVGRSGSGKSTLVSLLPRLYEVEDGELRIDGRDISEYRLTDLRNQIALVSQEVVLFNDTIERNIAYGALRAVDRDEVVEAARSAHAMDFIDDLPEGMDTVVGDKGVMLSGGQRQRLAIARALLKDAPILILDEATSALDTESERHIQAALDELMRNRTTLVIAHRLSTVENADRIVVLHEGRVVETGTHSELLARGGRYASLYRMQFNDAATG